MGNDVPGILVVYFEIAVVLMIPVSLTLLIWFRRAIAQEMLARYSASHAALPLAGAPSETVKSGAPDLRRTAARPLHKRLAVVYFLGATAASVVSTFMWFHLPDSAEFTPFRAFVVAYVYCWLFPPTLALLLAMPRKVAALLFVGYFVAGASAVFLWSVFSSFVFGKPDVFPTNNVGFYGYYLLLTAGPPAAVMLLTSFRKIRPVAPFVFAGLVAFSFGALGTQNAFTALVDSSEATRNLLLAIPHPLFTFFMLAALPAGYVCWLALRGLGLSFETKKFSDMQLLADTWWLIAFFWICTGLATEIGWWGLLGLLGFVAYRAMVAIGLSLWPMGEPAQAARDLLLLRVFGYQNRTEQLFDAVAQPWRFEGRVIMIAGADLAGRIIDPGTVVSFAGGRLRNEFVRNADELQRRLGALDEARDPDGRYRIGKFFCYADSWQPTVKALMQRSAIVLMDLRGFSQQNSGCLFELQELASGRKLDRTVFVVDRDTDVKLLRATLQNTWKETGLEGTTPIHLSTLEKQSGRQLQRVLKELRALPAAT